MSGPRLRQAERGRSAVPRQHGAELLDRRPDPVAQDVGEDRAVVGRDGEVAVDHLVDAEPRPGAVDLAAVDAAAEDERRVAPAVVDAVAVVLVRAPAELREREHGRAVHAGAHVLGERRERGPELDELVPHPPGARVAGGAEPCVHVPVADVEGDGLDAEAGLDDPGHVLQRVAEVAGRVHGAVRRVVRRRGDRGDGGERADRGLGGREDGGRSARVQRREGGRPAGAVGRRVHARDREVAEVVHRQHGHRPDDGVGDVAPAHLHRGERAARRRQAEGAPDPAGPGARAHGRVLHLDHGVEVGAVGVGQAGGVHHGERAVVVERLERRQARVQAEEAVELHRRGGRDPDTRPTGQVVGIADGHDGVEPVEPSAQRDHDHGVAGPVRGVRDLGRHGLEGGERDQRGTRAEQAAQQAAAGHRARALGAGAVVAAGAAVGRRHGGPHRYRW